MLQPRHSAVLLDVDSPWPEAVPWLEQYREREELELAEELRRELGGRVRRGQSGRELMYRYGRLARTLEVLGRFAEALAVLEEGAEALRQTLSSPGVQ